MQTLTTLQICDAFIAKILEIEPTLVEMRQIRWSFAASPHRQLGARAVMAPSTRNFDLMFGAGVPSYTWRGGTGTAYQVRLGVATSYAGVSPDILTHMVTADSVDLRRAFEQLRDPTLPGLVNIEALGIENENVDDDANAYVEHVFRIHYHQATA